MCTSIPASPSGTRAVGAGMTALEILMMVLLSSRVRSPSTSTGALEGPEARELGLHTAADSRLRQSKAMSFS